MNNKIDACYIRVSTDAQFEEGYSVDVQKEKLLGYCAVKGYDNPKLYIDGGWSGSNIERPEMQKLLRDISNGQVDRVVVYKLDRLSRSQKDTLFLIEDVFNPHDVGFISIQENFDTTAPMGRAMLGIMAVFAQLERETIRERTRMGMNERVKNGYWPGGGNTPFGYDYDETQGILVPNSDAGKVKQIFELYLSGYSTDRITLMLGIGNAKVTYSVIRRITYLGLINYNGNVYQGKHEPLIKQELFDKVQAEIANRSNKNANAGTNLLTGLLECKYCGAKMRYMKWGSAGYRLVCYSHVKSRPYLVKDENCPNICVVAE